MTPDLLWGRFCELAERVGEVEAILSAGRQSLRFADLPERLERVRDTLAEFGIGKGDRVVSVLPRGPETAVCYLGVAACATYVPLNPDFSEDEFVAHLRRLRPAVVILPDGGAPVARASASALGIGVLDLTSNVTDRAGTFDLRPCEGLDRHPCPRDWNGADDYALVLLTSGSTAQPKLVPLRVRHLLAYARASGEHYQLTPSDRCLHTMPMFHGHGLKSSLMVPLVNGSGVIASPGFDVPGFFQQMKVMRPTWYSAASSIHGAILARVGDFREIAEQAGLRFIRSGSSRLDPKVMAGLEETFKAPVLERYGMSECGNLTSNCLPPGIRKPGSVGRPVGNEVVVIDEAGCVLGPNCEGEVAARGPSVFDGYLDDPEANAKAFINGWFRTGDLGRFDDDGFLTLTGRVKDVINRGGEKIGTAEIEGALMRHPSVQEVCAFALPHPTLGEEVAAAVCVDHEVGELELQTFARGLLTGVKVPRRICVLPSLPKRANGKIDRRETARLCRDRLVEQQDRLTNIPPNTWSPLEREVATAWKAVLGVESVDREDDFFLIGGDSLQAYDLFARLQKTHRVVLDLAQIFDEAATVSGMARLVERARHDKTSARPEMSGVVTIKAGGTRPPLFAIPGSGGNVVGYIHLGRLLDARQPLIGLESRGVDGAHEPLSRLEDIAADNITRMKRVQPQGPYYLTGMCFGGRVAYEMARQLEATGERVGMLFMLDASAPFFNADGRPRGQRASLRSVSPGRIFLNFAYKRMKKHAASLASLRGADRRAFLREKLAIVADMVRHGDPFRGDRSQLYHRAVRIANKRAGRNYVPGRFDGPVVLLMARDQELNGMRNYRLDWLELLPQAGAPVFVAGANAGYLLLPPHVYEVADVINGRLEAIHAADKLREGTRAAS